LEVCALVLQSHSTHAPPDFRVTVGACAKVCGQLHRAGDHHGNGSDRPRVGAGLQTHSWTRVGDKLSTVPAQCNASKRGTQASWLCHNAIYRRGLAGLLAQEHFLCSRLYGSSKAHTLLSSCCSCAQLLIQTLMSYKHSCWVPCTHRNTHTPRAAN